MFGDKHKEYPMHISFLIVPGFSMLGFAAMLDPLRWANTMNDSPLYQWQIASSDGAPVKSSNDIAFLTDCSIDQVTSTDMLIVCAGFHPQNALNTKLIGSLRRIASQGIDMGGQDTGSYILAAAGLLDGYRTTIHWENHDSYREAFRSVTLVNELFEIDRNRFSCSGGLSGLDMMLHLIKQQHGNTLATSISDKLIYHDIRDGSQQQRMSIQTRYGVSNAKLIKTIENMNHRIEQRISIRELAIKIHISERELERLFRQYLDTTPTAFYRALRLEKSRALLQQTSDSITNVALRSGFGSVSHFSRSFHKHFGYPPRDERRLLLSQMKSGE